MIGRTSQAAPTLPPAVGREAEMIGEVSVSVGERIWLVTFMQYHLGYFDDETCRLEPIESPFGPKLFYALGINCPHLSDRNGPVLYWRALQDSNLRPPGS